MIRTMENAPPIAMAALDNDLCWTAVTARDAAFDGKFYYSVSTTGVYCRPSCASRLARRDNVGFHATRGDAEAAGFRPCKRCKPEQPPLREQNAQIVERACRLIETADEPLELERLAEAVGLSPYHFHRVFKAVAGVTPKAFAVAHRQKRVRANLKTNPSVTGAIHESGFNSSSRFYAGSSGALGMTPTDFRNGGKHVEMRFAIGECSLGSILVAATGKGVSAILLGDDPEILVQALQDGFPQARLIGGDADFERIVAKVVGLVERPGVGSDLPLDVRGTAFQHRVWQALREIPVGATATYSQIAERIGAPKAVRAVAGACAANKLAVVIPCHRVIRNDGSLSGYRWGVERKRALLAREADWARIGADLDARGYAVIANMLPAEECRPIAGLYPDDERFRSRVVMARHGFGRGEYKYFRYPLPDVVAALRDALYPPLAKIATRWNEELGVDGGFPARHSDFLQRCHDAGQTRPTALLLQYQTGDYNCLHQDLYGDLVFPLQAAVLLSEPGRDFTGGEFVLTEQRPRMQSRAAVVPLKQGDAVLFAVSQRPARGARGFHRVTMRHGVSEVLSGRRHVLGVIFHDAR